MATYAFVAGTTAPKAPRVPTTAATILSFNFDTLLYGVSLLREIPGREKWLSENADAMQSLSRGVADAAAGRLRDLGSFAQYVDEIDEDD